MVRFIINYLKLKKAERVIFSVKRQVEESSNNNEEYDL